MKSLIDWLQQVTGFAPDTLRNLIDSLLILLFLGLVRTGILRVVWRQTSDVSLRYRWRKTSSYLVFLIACLLVGRIWFKWFESLATFLGLLSAGLAIALQDLVKSLAGWAFVLWRKPFSVGDRIQVGSHRGDVIDLRIFKFSLLEIGNWVDADQSTGRVLHLPNSLILSEVIGNYSKGFDFIWNELPVLVTFESNWEKAKTLLQEIAHRNGSHLSAEAEFQVKEASKQYMIFFSKLTPTVYTSVQDSGVLLTIRYLTAPRERRGSTQSIWEDILHTFAQHQDIDFAYPTQRFYHNVTEGKSGARATPDGG